MEAANPEANIIFGAGIDESMGDKVRITVIATGFEKTPFPPREPVKSARDINRDRLYGSNYGATGATGATGSYTPGNYGATGGYTPSYTSSDSYSSHPTMGVPQAPMTQQPAQPAYYAPQQPAQPQPTVPTVPAVPSVPAQPGPIEHQDQQSGQPAPRVRHYDWNGAVQPLVGQMLQASGVNAGSILLVDSVNNRTNGSLNAGEATTALRSALAGNGKFTLVSAQQLAVAKQQLGLSPQDSLGSRSKAMGIARNVGAQYVLYSNATGNVNAPELKMQLMLVQTGEIIWSGKGAVQQQ